MKCFKCGFNEHEEGSEYCENCGFELNSNYCTNDNCNVRNNGESIPCSETACYCNYCGAETEYYRQGLIKSIDCKKE